MAINLQNIQWKLHLDESAVGTPHEWFKAFAPWIPDSPEVFVDVADYAHVEDGPVVFLSGHNVCYSLDSAGRRHGLLYERRQPAEGTAVVFELTTQRELEVRNHVAAHIA